MLCVTVLWGLVIAVLCCVMCYGTMWPVAHELCYVLCVMVIGLWGLRGVCVIFGGWTTVVLCVIAAQDSVL